MKHYVKSLARQFENVLIAREAQLRAVLDTVNKKELATEEAGNAEVQDFKDLAERESQLDMAALEAGRAADELSQVLAAMRRLQDGSFGQCAECGKPIDLRRLEAMPAAALCLTCQGAREETPTTQHSSTRT